MTSALGRGAGPQLLLPKLGFPKVLPVETQERIHFQREIGSEGPSLYLVGLLPIAASAWVSWKPIQKDTMWHLRHLSYPGTKRFTSVCNRHVSRGSTFDTCHLGGAGPLLKAPENDVFILKDLTN